MFVQAHNAEGQLIYFEFENLEALNPSNDTISLSGTAFYLWPGEVKRIVDRMCRAGLIAGLGRGAAHTAGYPDMERI